MSLVTGVENASRTAACEALDLWLYGTMLRVACSEVAGADRSGGTSDLAGIDGLLGDGFELRFPTGVRVQARLVRIAWRPGNEDAVDAGREFVEPLSEAEIASLGLASRHRPPEVGVSTPPAELMSYVRDERRPLTRTVLAADGQPLHAGPRFGVEGAALATHLAPVDPTALVARLSSAAHTISVGFPGAKPWMSQAYLLAVRLLDGQQDSVEVVLSATKPPSQALLRCMRHRGASRPA